MGDPKIYTAEEAKALLAAATTGPWLDGPPYKVTFDESRNMLTLSLIRGDMDLVGAAHDLAASVVHHARRADAAEAEVERLKVEAAGVAYFRCWPDGFLEALGAASANTVDDVVARVQGLLAAEAEVKRLRDLVRRAFVDGFNWTGDGPREDVDKAWSESIACTALGEPR